MIDLHAHTQCSDGTDTPAELVARATELGLRALAICDHDTTDAYRDEAVRSTPALRIVPGIELSIEFSGGTFHLLGLLIDPQHAAFDRFVAQLQQWRDDRNQEMLQILADHGFPLRDDDLAEVCSGGQLGRPHLALAMVNRGYVASKQDAFDQWLGSGRPCHLPKRKPQPREAIALVHEAGGAAVLAHPVQLGLGASELELQLTAWCRVGLDGLEAFHSAQSSELAAGYVDLARRHQLLVTAGSDYHGTVKPNVHLGLYPGTPPPDDELLGTLEAAAERWR